MKLNRVETVVSTNDVFHEACVRHNVRLEKWTRNTARAGKPQLCSDSESAGLAKCSWYRTSYLSRKINVSRWIAVSSIKENLFWSSSHLIRTLTVRRLWRNWRTSVLGRLTPCHGSSDSSPVSHRGGQGSSPGQSMWDLWWTKWHWDMLFCDFPCQYHSTGFSML
jgi:hypothetical protein